MNSHNLSEDDDIKKLDKESFDQLRQWYVSAIERKQTKLIFLIVFLGISTISQFVIVDYSFVINFGLDKDSSDSLFVLIPILFISGLITAALPITTFVDEFKLLEYRLELNIGDKKLSPILWIILPADFLLTFQAICAIGGEKAKYQWIVTLLGFLVAAIFATASLYTSRGIAASFRQFSEAKKNLKVLEIYRVNPIDLYEDIERVELRRRLDQARADLDQAKQAIEDIKLENQESISNLNKESSDQLREKEREIKELEDRIKRFEENIKSVNELRAKFNKIRTPIVDLIGQGKSIFGKFSELDESVQDFSFPRIELRTLASKNGGSAPQPVYYMKWQNSNYSWEDLKLPSEPSTVGRKLLGLIVQQGNLPRPDVRDFAPRGGLANCMVLRFDDYGVVVYCRDEGYRQGEVWNPEDQMIFEEQIVNEQNLGLRVLRFSAQEIMSNPSRALERISDALISRAEVEDEE